MNILGLSSNYHDASATLVIDGKVIASAAEERFSLEKHDPSFPKNSINFCIEQAGLRADQLDLVVYHEDPISKFTRSLSSAFKNFPFSNSLFVRTAKDFLGLGFWIKYDIAKELGISPAKVKYMPHHMSHAAHSFFTSPFQEATIMTIDAAGEWSTSALFKASKINGIFKIVPVHVTPFPHSLGLIYSAFTGFLGFKVNDGECSTMALAAFGQPNYVNQIKNIILLKDDGSFEIDLSYFDFSSDEKLPLTQKFIDVFGKSRPINDKIYFQSFSKSENIDRDQQRYADIAASIQLVLQKAVLGYAKKALQLAPSENLCYAGGVALNCVANAQLENSKIFKNIYIPPDPGDGGASMGAALYAASLFDSSNTNPARVSPYLGKSYNVESDFLEMLKFLKSKKKHPENNSGYFFKQYQSETEIIKFTAEQLANNKIIGWFNSRFENGPRALGNRSILCRTDNEALGKHLSEKVKIRAGYRPYACSILGEKAFDYLKIENHSNLSKWMQTSLKIKSSKIKELIVASHIDETTRAQIVYEVDNSTFYQLISEFNKLTGIPALLNTSFNLSGMPLVASPYDALMMFTKTEMDIVVIENLIVSKEPL